MPPFVRYINQRTSNLAPAERHQVHTIVYRMDCLDRIRCNLNERVLAAIEDCLRYQNTLGCFNEACLGQPENVREGETSQSMPIGSLERSD